MTPHDQLFKEVLQTFLRDFMALFFPQWAASVDWDSVTFLDKELFTDLGEGRVREADVIAQVRTRDGQPELLLIHAEVQSERRGAFGARMWEYYALLRLRYRLPVLPIVLYLVPGASGITRKRIRKRCSARLCSRSGTPPWACPTCCSVTISRRNTSRLPTKRWVLWMTSWNFTRRR